jgi:hypothetical protein
MFDWNWTKDESRISESALLLYQLFLICKAETSDMQIKAGKDRFQFSPTKEIDAVWHAHIQRPLNYLQMHHALFHKELSETGKCIETLFIDRIPNSSTDNELTKNRQIHRLLGYMRYIYPDSHLLVQEEEETSTALLQNPPNQISDRNMTSSSSSSIYIKQEKNSNHEYLIIRLLSMHDPNDTFSMRIKYHSSFASVYDEYVLTHDIRRKSELRFLYEGILINRDYTL